MPAPLAIAGALSGAKSAIAAIPRPVKIGLGVALVALIIYLIGKQRGKNKTKEKYSDREDLPTGGYGIPAIGVDNKGNAIAWNMDGELARKLKEAMEGWDIFKVDPYTKKAGAMNALVPLTDDQFVAVWNTFNRLYGHLDYGNLRDWIEDDEWPSEAQDGEVLARMNRLGLFRQQG